MTRLSDGSLIRDWPPRLPAVVLEEPVPDPAEILANRIVAAVDELKHALAALPTPQIHIDPPDLADVVTAVTAAAGPGIDADDLADAIARKFQLPEPVSNEPLIDAIKEAFEKMDHRLMGMPAFGASGPSNIASDPNRRLGIVESISGTVTTVGPDLEHRFDYDVRTDSSPVYVGYADPNTATSSATWTVVKFTYDASNRATRKQLQSGIAWDNRTAGW